MPVATSFPLKNTSIRIPSRGLGTFQVDPSVYPEGSVKASVLHALKLGYKHIDAALAYGWGAVERDIGAAIRESGVPREELFVVTKLHNCFHAPEDVEVGMDMSLKNLGLDYGVSNFSSPKLKRLLSVCRIHPVVNQVELNPYFPQKQLLRFCQEHDIHVTAYGPLGCAPVPYLIGRKGPGPLEDPTVRHLPS
ncbi:predicted protein [Uncinocarpus reesii 1704]|uniref:NADP-dependent oxidoreductase domain-containing protein n=1 Tax=Uncinocarpus reesii (strain UAMH 1704) TaxID=336963 RepID=C4JYY6_UNCRE|nr:uncharacterized protein UREG_07387 [Uncinocarpus reesii 1704]EEP82522.1 predicted protein [Uncinocarpus reesii 1704]